MTETSRMLAEAREAPAVVARQLALHAEPLARLGARLRERPPAFVMTCARGSSDHATLYARYAIEQRLGFVCTSAPPSVQTLYPAPLRVRDALFLAVSQSGKSPDLVAKTAAARAGGATTVAFVNDPASPLAAACEFVVPLEAGPELSVAATKSYIAAVTAQLHLVAAWAGDAELLAALRRLPERIAAAQAGDWSGLLALREARNLLVIGRGAGLAVASEMALKLKETCGLHAEAFSGAEVKHGPMALIEPGFPVLAAILEDEAGAAMRGAADDFAAMGARVLAFGPGAAAPALPGMAADHPLADGVPMIAGFYVGVEALARARGWDVDRPRHLSKVTETR
ncbi:MAG TPA: SIS domain-containing protein [Alphaproteobacteria bacterium]|nr:SIS domain-containing protein [Alphaproteobacteria bacterium]